MALGLLNCDVDELAATRSGRPIHDLLQEARRGLVVFRGQWVEAAEESGGPARERQRDFHRRLSDPRAALSRPCRRVIDPKRHWFDKLEVHPYGHCVAGRPWFGKFMPPDAFYRHFKGINSNRKEGRTSAPAGTTEIDQDLLAAFERVVIHG